MQTGDRNAEKHVYENREQALMLGRHNSSDPYYSSPRRASFDDGVFMPARMDSGSNFKPVTPLRKMPNGEDDSLYQNVPPGTRSVHPSRASPTKKSHLSPVSVPVPEGYYAVTPPTLVRHHHSSNASPSSSPDESTLEQLMSHRVSETDNIYANTPNPDLAFTDNMILKSSTRRSKALSAPSDAPEMGSVYQNLDFMRGSGADKRYLIYSYFYIHTNFPGNMFLELTC